MHGEAIPLSNLDNRSNGLLSSDSPSQEEFADKLGMSPSTVKRMEADKRKIAESPEVAAKLKSGEIPFSEAILSTRHLSYWQVIAHTHKFPRWGVCISTGGVVLSWNHSDICRICFWWPWVGTIVTFVTLLLVTLSWNYCDICYIKQTPSNTLNTLIPLHFSMFWRSGERLVYPPVNTMFLWFALY